MGSAAVQGALWSARAQDWAELMEQQTLPLFAAALHAVRARRGTRLLDVGCGAGLVALLAALRGAEVSAVDAAPALLAIARERLPGADVREADLEALPFGDATFDAVLGVQSVFFAADMAAALRELARVARPGSRVVVTGWGLAERCEYARVVGALRPLLPPPPPGAVNPFAIDWEPLLEGAGLRVLERGEVACPFIYPDEEEAWRAHASVGPVQRAVQVAGEEAVRAAVGAVDRAHAQAGGSVHYDNTFVWVATARP